MNWKCATLVFFALLTTPFSFGQSENLLNATTVEEIGKKTEEQIEADNDGPLPYGYIHNRDILWSSIVWEFVDLNQKQNFPYYFPINNNSTSDNRRSLFDTLIKGLNEGKIKEAYSDSFFNSTLTREEIAEKLINVRTDGDYKDTFKIKSEDITGYNVKGMWYFDKLQGELKYRLLAIAPMGPDVQTLGVAEIEDDQLYELFWIFYPTARQVLHDQKVFNHKNSAQSVSFDHLLTSRHFSGTITREENIYGNREIKDYVKGNSLFQLLEADKIKESIRDREIDMWSY